MKYHSVKNRSSRGGRGKRSAGKRRKDHVSCGIIEITTADLLDIDQGEEMLEHKGVI